LINVFVEISGIGASPDLADKYQQAGYNARYEDEKVIVSL